MEIEIHSGNTEILSHDIEIIGRQRVQTNRGATRTHQGRACPPTLAPCPWRASTPSIYRFKSPAELRYIPGIGKSIASDQRPHIKAWQFAQSEPGSHEVR
jgi:hypothetical protein